MLSSAFRTSRHSALRLAQQQAGASRRSFTVGAIRSADLIQDLYLRELKSYKVPTVKASDAEGHVQKFAVPKAGKSPEEADLASQLKQYEEQDVEVEGQSSEGAVAQETNWFEHTEEVVDPKEDAHH